MALNKLVLLSHWIGSKFIIITTNLLCIFLHLQYLYPEMNSNYTKSKQSKTPSSSSSASSSSSVSLNNFNFDFDLGIGSNRSNKPLNDHKKPIPNNSSYSQPRPTWQPNKPSWTHQPAPIHSNPTGLPGGPTSMAGDIFGKTWGSTTTQTQPTIGIINNKNPNLFGDLVSSALGQGSNKTSSSSTFNVPLKNATPPSNKNSSFSMGNLADSLPKTGKTNTVHSGNFVGLSGNSMNANKRSNLGGSSMSSGIGINFNNNDKNKDPFSSLGSGIGSKKSGSLNSSVNKPQKKIDSEDDGFGDFQNASKSTTTASFPSGGGSTGIDIDFSGFAAASNQSPPVQPYGGGDPMDMLFSASTASAGGASGGQPASEMDDWGLESDFGGGSHDVGGSTTELEGLPPPPAGISGSTAKGKGMDSYKQGQFADAIKWLSWAVILLEKAGDNAATFEALSSRASCYKEVGEYKKAVADCTKILEDDQANVSVLVQRALLYESMEKYKLGAEDLRTVLKIDPSNRIAKSTVHRLARMAE